MAEELTGCCSEKQWTDCSKRTLAADAREAVPSTAEFCQMAASQHGQGELRCFTDTCTMMMLARQLGETPNYFAS